jgi:alkanesulfonate monooxygenase SsuD/methylene tetrahydromethanopterin reductase-like flavin-dependent oxidoreductase (luciferase family)
LPLRFGIFDWIDDTGGTLADAYAQRLKLVELADRHGLYAYHLAEHHGTPLGQAPSPNVFLAAAAARTERLRLGALVNVLPLYDPVRLVEEVCMLDHLTRGRLELGIGRGGSPGELALYNVTAEESREIYREAFDVLIEGLRSGRFEHEGRYFTRKAVSTPLRPYQRPYPPLWYPTSFPDSIPWIAEQALNTVFAFLMTRAGGDPGEQIERYRAIFEQHRDDADRLNAHVAEPLYGNVRHIFVADDDAPAQALAREALKRYFESFNYIWMTQQGKEYFPSDVDAFIEQGFALVGSAANVRDQVARALERLGGNYFVGVFAFGNLGEHALRSLDLFAREVMPGIAPPPAGQDRRPAQDRSGSRPARS